MGTKLKRNAILAGYINSYCLVCECSFETYNETSDHIDDKTHADKLLACPYLKKFGNNCIRKVNKGYFCEVCGLLLATAVKVSVHVQEKSHIKNKATFLLRRQNGVSGVIAFDDLLIDENAWHSLSEDACAICNEEYDNINIHKTDSNHLLKLVQTKVEFGADNSIYRKTDDSSFHCLTCNSVFVLNILNEHYTDADHKKLYAKCQEEYKKFVELTKLKPTEKTMLSNDKNKKGETNDKKSDLEGKEDEVKKTDEVKRDKDNVKDNKTKTKDEKVEVIENKEKNAPGDKNHNNIKENDREIQKAEVKTEEGNSAENHKTSAPVQEDEATVYAKENSLTYNAGNSNAFCRICETKLPSPLRSMKEHVNGKEHKSRVAKEKPLTEKPRITKIPMGQFVRQSVYVSNMFHHDSVVNLNYCMPFNSFFMLTEIGSTLRCVTCEVTVHADGVNRHIESQPHQRFMRYIPVITSLPDSEFVREVRPNIYHCGFCNMILPTWDDVENHLQSREHRDNKNACSQRLQHNLSIIEGHRIEEALKIMWMQILLK